MSVKIDVVISYYGKGIYFNEFLVYEGQSTDIAIEEVLSSLEDEVINFSRTIIAHDEVCYAKTGFPQDLDKVWEKKKMKTEAIKTESQGTTVTIRRGKGYRVYATSLVTYVKEFSANSEEDALEKAFFDVGDWEESGDTDWDIDRVELV